MARLNFFSRVVSGLAASNDPVLTVWPPRRLWVVGGVLFALAGVILILGGVIYNELSGFRYYTRLIESEITVLPSLPFVIKLDRFTMEYHSPDAVVNTEIELSVPEQPEALLTLLRNDKVLVQITAGPGRPVDAEGVTLLPSDTDTGWAFTLVVRDPGGREKAVPVIPWSPPLIRLGLTRQQIFADSVSAIKTSRDGDKTTARPNAVEVFLIEENGDRQSLGFATDTAPVSASGYMVSVWDIRPYTGLHVYRRPGKPILITGIAFLLFGLAIFGFIIGSRSKRETKGE